MNSKVKIYKKNEYSNFIKDFGAGSEIHKIAINLYSINKAIEQNLFEQLTEYNGFLTGE